MATVVVPAYRGADTIVAVLRGLAEQDLREPFETIVVSSGGDATTDIVRRGFPDVILLDGENRMTPGAARNAGVTISRAPIVAFLADDCVPEPDWLRRRVEAHAAGYGLVAGFVDVARPSTVPGWAQYFAKFWGMQRLEGQILVGRGPIFHLSYARQLLDRPFDEDVTAGEDTSYNHALIAGGHRVRFDSAIRVRHVNDRTWREVVEAQREQGAATGALCCRSSGLGVYYVPSVRGGPWMPLIQGWRALMAVAVHRPRLLGRFLLAAPLIVTAIAVRRRAFRRAYAGRTPAPDPGAAAAIRRICGPAARRPRVSVLVPAFNEEAAIGACLDSILAQTEDHLEVIVLDDGSVDRTAEIARSRAVTVLKLPHGGPALAKNAGAAVARGDVLVFVDADLILDPKCIEVLCRPILAGEEVGTYTRDMEVSNVDDPWSRCWTHNRRAVLGQHLPAGLPDRWENFRAVSRQRFLTVGGFDDVGYGEDMTLSPKLGAMAMAVPGAVMAHRNPDSLGEIWENARWVGRGVAFRTVPHVALRYAPWRSFRRGVLGARQLGMPRFALFALTYDTGVLTGYLQSKWGDPHHAK